MVEALGYGPHEKYINQPVRQVLAPLLQPHVDKAGLVIISQQGLAPMVLPHSAGYWVTELHHVSSEMARQHAATVTGRRQRWIVEREAAQAQRLEDRAVRSYDGVLVCAGEDAQTMRVPPAKLLIAPNGVDVDHYTVTPLPPRAPAHPARVAQLPPQRGRRRVVRQRRVAAHPGRSSRGHARSGRSPAGAVPDGIWRTGRGSQCKPTSNR